MDQRTHVRVFVVQQRVPRRQVLLQGAAANRLGAPGLANAHAPGFLDDQFRRPNGLPIDLQRQQPRTSNRFYSNLASTDFTLDSDI